MTNAKAAYDHPQSVEWGTPQVFYDALDAEFRFTLDVAANIGNAKAAKFFTEADDGLSKSWRGETCWMNPPYGRAIGSWMAKAYQESRNPGTTVVCLVPARTDTRWWWSTAIHGEVRFIRGRLSFTGGSPTNPQSHNAPFPVAVVVFQRGRHAAALWTGGPTR